LQPSRFIQILSPARQKKEKAAKADIAAKAAKAAKAAADARAKAAADASAKAAAAGPPKKTCAQIAKEWILIRSHGLNLDVYKKLIPTVWKRDSHQYFGYLKHVKKQMSDNKCTVTADMKAKAKIAAV